MDEPPLDWPGVLEPSLQSKDLVTAGHHLADLADEGDWPALLDLLATTPALSVNQWRPGSTDWLTPLHHAARHGAPVKVVAALLELGALRCLRDARGWTAYDIAVDACHPPELTTLLAPPPSPLSDQRARALDSNLEWAIDGAIRTARVFEGHDDHALRTLLRYPPVTVLHEAAARSARFAVPGLPGGVQVTLRRGYLEAIGGQCVHVVTERGAVLVSEEASWVSR